jgi:hypothetical protein
MRRVLHIDENTTYTSAGGMLFVHSGFDSTVIICHQPNAIDELVVALRIQQKELENENPGDSGPES